MGDMSPIFTILPALPGKIEQAVKAAFFSGVAFEEIRLRRGKAVCITKSGNSFFLTGVGKLSATADGAIICENEDFENTLVKICENSVFSHTKEIENGYISMPGGIRVGVTGDLSPTVSGIYSINIRIPREIKGCADEAFNAFSSGMLIAGPPGSGKTTMLRELIRKLSFSGKRICVIDSRREISGGNKYEFDLGPNTDIAFTNDRAFGALSALKSMYPQIIAFDEIGTSDEVRSVLEAFNSGVYILTTAHAKSIDELRHRPVTSTILKSGVIKTVVLLNGEIGKRPEIYSSEVILNEADS